jgi:hypothetical protein
MTQSNSSEYQCGAESAKRFRDFTRAIIAVPKSEIDKAAKKLPPQKPKARKKKKSASK